MSKEKQTEYRSGVGMLLYLVKLSKLDLSNPVRELSKGMDSLTKGRNQMMMRVMKYMLDTKNMGLKFIPKKLIGECWY